MKQIKLSQTYTDNKEIKSLTRVIKSGWLTSGEITKKFEEKVSNFIGSKYIIATNSCTNGIFVTLKALGLKKGDEIITSPYTFISTINTLYQLNLRIVFADINLDDFNIDYDELKKKISKKTKCILITHYGGIPCNRNKIIKLCKNKIKLVEDSAGALGAAIGKKKIGSFNNSVSVFSLYPNKIITTGEGGLISTNDRRLAKKIRTLISIGITKDPWKRTKENLAYKYDLKFPGYKFNFTDLQAAIGIEQIKKIKSILSYRRKLRKYYNKGLKELINKNLISVYKNKKNMTSAEYIYTILINPKFKISRDHLILYLKKNKINCTVHYIPAYHLSYYKNKFKNNLLTNTNLAFKNLISLPFHNHLKMKDIAYIVKKILDYYKNEKHI